MISIEIYSSKQKHISSKVINIILTVLFIYFSFQWNTLSQFVIWPPTAKVQHKEIIISIRLKYLKPFNCVQIISINTGWNDKIVALEKTTWFHFRLMKTGFLFYCRPSTSWPVVYKSQEW